MLFRYLLLAYASVVLLADAPLKSALGLSVDQARQVQEIQQKHQGPFRTKRGEYMKEMRKLRQARVANDSQGIAQHEKVARQLHGEMLALMTAEDNEIRLVLTPEQNKKFDAHLKLRRDMVGSHRDDKEFTGR